MTDDPTVANFTPEVKRAADEIRKIVRNLSLTELLALRESLADDFPIDPFGGVREPREPRPRAGAGGAIVIPEDTSHA